jgi:Transmembrane secretion effector
MASGVVHTIWVLGAVMVVGGAAWVSFLSLFNVHILSLAPDWVRARVLSIAMLVFQGAVAAGSATWGALAARRGIDTALLCAGGGAILSTVLAGFLRLPDTTRLDLTPWNHWRAPMVGAEFSLSGPVLVTVEYDVGPERAADFLAAMREFGRIRQRDGASHWGICRDLETPDRYLETFIVGSWDEHLRQHERMTRADSGIEESLRGYVRGEPVVRHLLYL